MRDFVLTKTSKKIYLESHILEKQYEKRFISYSEQEKVFYCDDMLATDFPKSIANNRATHVDAIFSFVSI